MIGKTISHYKILEKLGEGGMGVVYKAEDTKLKRQVALKFLPANRTWKPESRQRFIQEAQAASALDHANICTVHEIDETSDDQTFIVMALYEGEILAEKLKRGPLNIQQAIDIAVQAGRGLERVHRKGIVHRDIKPANILITNDNEVKILDFGLAKLKGQSDLTKDGTTVGTVAYMSPEQASGEKVDHRSDIWSLGVVLYQMLSGQLPFKGDYEQAVVYSILNEAPDSMQLQRQGVPQKLADVVQLMLAKNPAERVQSIEDVLNSLQEFSTSEAFSRPSSSTEVIKKPVSKNPWMLAAMFMLVFVAIAAYFFLFKSSGTPPTIKEKMLVVLPFENLGAAEDDYFADGITEEITSRLAPVHGLGVISRTSAIQYKNTKKTIKQIGEELGVGYVLEGTVRWTKGEGGKARVRVTPQLIEVSDDTHLWSNRYDRLIEDIFTVQSEIAEKVIKQLDIKLLKPQRKALYARPTSNLKAYDCYLRANDYYRKAWDHLDYKAYKRAAQLFNKATELDPKFTLAFVELSHLHSGVYFGGFDRTTERLKLSKAAVDEALRLQPDLPDAHLALAHYYYRGFLDYDQALTALLRVQEAWPNYSDSLVGFIRRRQGRWQESTAILERAFKLDPRSDGLAAALGSNYKFLRQHEQANTWFDRSLSLNPKNINTIFHKSVNLINRKGSTNDAHAFLRQYANDTVINQLSFMLTMYDGDWDKLLKQLPLLPFEKRKFPTMYFSKDNAYAQIYFAQKNQNLMKRHAEAAVESLEKEVAQYANDARIHAALGFAYALLGKKEKAILHGEKTVQLYPMSQDAMDGPVFIANLAEILMLVGEYERALEKLDYLLSIPSDITIPRLQHGSAWERIRSHPGFQKLVEKYSKVKDKSQRLKVKSQKVKGKR